jgi:hypothetical protein
LTSILFVRNGYASTEELAGGRSDGVCSRVGCNLVSHAEARAKPKSAMDKLVEAFLKLRAEAKERMSEKEFREADRQFHELADKIRARRRRAVRP